MGTSIGHLAPREARTRCLIPCRMQLDGGWTDGRIHNISSRGLMIACARPPLPKAYVDIRRGTIVIIGRVVWVRGGFFGVRTQDRLDVPEVITEASKHPIKPANDEERRIARRDADEAIAARRVERSRLLGRAMQFGSLSAAVMIGGSLIAVQAYAALAAPLSAITRTLDGSR